MTAPKRRYVNAAMPTIRDDGLPHHVEQSARRWGCLPDCASCVAAGEFLHGPAVAADPADYRKAQR